MIDWSPVTLIGDLKVSVPAVFLAGFSVGFAGIGVVFPLVDVVSFMCTIGFLEAPMACSVATEAFN